MTQPFNPKRIPGQDTLNDLGGIIDDVVPGDHQPLGDAIAGGLDDNPKDNNLPSDQQSGSSSAFGAIADAIKEGFAPLLSLKALADKVTSLFLPTSIVRFVCGIGGIFFIILAIVLFAREVKGSAPNS